MTAEVLTPIRLRTHIFKGCQRCGGDLRLERATDVPFGGAEYDYVCLQCGRTTSLAAMLDRLQAAGRAAAA
jgi:hypothetical protein